MELKKVKFKIEIEMLVPYVSGKTSLIAEVRNILDDCLPGVEYWDFVENSEPVTIDTIPLSTPETIL